MSDTDLNTPVINEDETILPNTTLDANSSNAAGAKPAALLPKGSPLPPIWPPWPAWTFFTRAEHDLIVKLAQGQTEDDWRCTKCRTRYDTSEALLRHICNSWPCGGWLSNQQLSAGQCLAILAAVDYEGVKEEVEYYVEEWEAGVPVDSFYESDFETDSDTEATQSTPHKTRLRLNPPARPTEGTSSTTTATRNRSRPQSQASSSGSSDDSGDDDSEASMHDNNNDVPQSTGAPNFYNADKNTHIFINVDPDNDLPENILAENILPLEPPSYLSDKNVTVYERLFERIERYSAHRMGYLRPNSNQVGDTEQLLADWNAAYQVGQKGGHATYNAWTSRRLHDIQALKKLLELDE